MIHDLISAFSKFSLVIGRLTPQGVNMLGTGFLLDNQGSIATTHHVIGSDTTNLVIILPANNDVNDYQDLSITSCELTNAVAVEIDPARDIAILKSGLQWSGNLPSLGSFDSSKIGDTVNIFGYPHCTHSRKAFTFQKAEVGAKVLMDNLGIASKHAVINVQARPGQSGSPVIDPASGTILGMMVGAWVPAGSGLRLGDINPYELHQTTHCISASHIKEML
jgi:hypothetical protein